MDSLLIFSGLLILIILLLILLKPGSSFQSCNYSVDNRPFPSGGLPMEQESQYTTNIDTTNIDTNFYI
jgi:hypothetical protein